jgi:hypothetical protein
MHVPLDVKDSMNEPVVYAPIKGEEVELPSYAKSVSPAAMFVAFVKNVN